MALNNLGLGFVFTARDLATGTINRVGGAFGTLDQRAMRAQQSYQANFVAMGAGLAIMGAGAAVLGGAFALADQASHFEQGLARVGAVARASVDDMVLLRQAAIDAGIATQFSPDEAVEGLGALAQQGFNTQRSIQLLSPVLDLAAGGMIGVEEAAQSVTAAVHVFGLNVEQSGMVADQLLRITNATALAAGDMELAIGTVARGARLAHQGIEEMLPAIGLLRNTGVDVSVAAQSVSSALTFMSSRAEAIQQTLGVELVQTMEDGTQSFRPFMDIALEAGEALDERFANPAERAAAAVELFGRFGVGAVTGVADAVRTGVTDSEGHFYRGAAAVAYLRNEMLNAEGTAAEFRERMLDTFAGQQTLLQGSMQTLGVIVGEGFTRGLRPFVEGTIGLINRAIGFLNEIPVEVRGAMAAAVIAGGALTFALGGLIAMGAAIALITPFIPVIAAAVGNLVLALLPFVALAAGVLAMNYAFGRLRATVSSFGDMVSTSFNRARLVFRGLVQLFTTGELSGAIAQEFLRAENGPLLRFVINLYAMGFRIIQFFRGIGIGFEAALSTMGPSVDRMVGAFMRLGRALGLVGDEGLEAVAGMPSEEFVSRGAIIGDAIGGVVDWIVHAITAMTEFGIGAMRGAAIVGQFLEPVFDDLGVTFGLLWEQVSALLQTFGLLSAESEGQTSGWQTFGEVIGGVVTGAVGILAIALDGIVYTFTALIWLANQFILFIRWIAEQGPVALQRFGQFFLDLADNISIAFGDFQIATAGILSPELPEEAVLQIHAEQSARRAAITARGAAVDGMEASYGEAPAVAEATAAHATEQRTEASLRGVRDLLERQATERGQQPWEVSMSIDGEVLARAAGRGERRDDAASFMSVPVEE